MSAMLIDINDQAITIFQDDFILSESGYAFVEKDRVLFGEEARLAGKKFPRQGFHHYWHQLNDEPLETLNDDIHSHIDLVYWQLKSLLDRAPKAQSCILLVSNYFDIHQLSVLLGICKACELPVSDILSADVGKGYAAYQAFGGQERLQFVDIDLHQCRLSHCTMGNNFKVNDEQVFANKGIHQLYLYLSDWLNQRFIDERRFDPYHDGESERLLAEYIPKLLGPDWNGRIYDVEINEHKLRVSQQEIRALCLKFFNFLIEQLDAKQPCIFAPGFIDINRYLDVTNKVFQTEHFEDLYRCLNEHEELGVEGAPLFLKRSLALKKRLTDSKLKASHIILADRAYPLNAQPIYFNANASQPLSLEAQQSSCLKLGIDGKLQLLLDNAVQVNNLKAVDGQQVHCSDEIKIQANVFRLIKVEQEVKFNG